MRSHTKFHRAGALKTCKTLCITISLLVSAFAMLAHAPVASAQGYDFSASLDRAPPGHAIALEFNHYTYTYDQLFFIPKTENYQKIIQATYQSGAWHAEFADSAAPVGAYDVEIVGWRGDERDVFVEENAFAIDQLVLEIVLSPTQYRGETILATVAMTWRSTGELAELFEVPVSVSVSDPWLDAVYEETKFAYDGFAFAYMQLGGWLGTYVATAEVDNFSGLWSADARSAFYLSSTAADHIISVYPGVNELNATCSVSAADYLKLDIYDDNGALTWSTSQSVSPGIATASFNLAGLAAGRYRVRFELMGTSTLDSAEFWTTLGVSVASSSTAEEVIATTREADYYSIILSKTTVVANFGSTPYDNYVLSITTSTPISVTVAPGDVSIARLPGLDGRAWLPLALGPSSDVTVSVSREGKLTYEVHALGQTVRGVRIEEKYAFVLTNVTEADIEDVWLELPVEQVRLVLLADKTVSVDEEGRFLLKTMNAGETRTYYVYTSMGMTMSQILSKLFLTEIFGIPVLGPAFALGIILWVFAHFRRRGLITQIFVLLAPPAATSALLLTVV